jgi:hypothetical protein
VRCAILIAAVLAAALPGCDGGMNHRGDGGACGAAGDPCCGVGSCDDGLACVAGTCFASTCGGSYQACCSSGAPCAAGLTCSGGFCSDATMADGGQADCGMRGGTCCAGNPRCGASLACLGGVCMDAPPCGSEGMACCSGATCEAGNVCVDGVCRREVAIPMCAALGAACAVGTDCCSGNCGSGRTCQSGPPPPPPPADCAGAFTCFDCAYDSACGWCDGICTSVNNRSGCTDFRAEIWECVL